MNALNKAMGWIVAVWLLLAVFNDGYAPYAALIGAVFTVVIWAVLAVKLGDKIQN